MKKIVIALIVLGAFSSCKKENTSPSDHGFTPPTTNYLILDGQEHDSASAFGIYETGIPDFSIRNASFTGITLTPPIYQIEDFSMSIDALTYLMSSQNPYYRDMHDSIPEGGYVKYPLAGVNTGDHKFGFWMYVTLGINEDYHVQGGGSVGGGNGYNLSGNLYISKLNGKLRYTTDGTISVANDPNSVLKHTISFSIAEDAGTF